MSKITQIDRNKVVLAPTRRFPKSNQPTTGISQHGEQCVLIKSEETGQVEDKRRKYQV